MTQSVVTVDDPDHDQGYGQGCEQLTPAQVRHDNAVIDIMTKRPVEPLPPDNLPAVPMSAELARLVEAEATVLPPVLPEWARSADMRARWLRTMRRKATWYALSHTVRAPVYAWRTTSHAVVGSAIGAWRFGRWLTAAEFSPVIGEAVAKGKWTEARDEILDRGAVAKGRLKTLGLSTLGGVSAEVIAHAYLGNPVYLGSAAVLYGAAAAAGWKHSRLGPIIDPIGGQPRMDLNKAYVEEALRACGLLKPGKGDEPGPGITLTAPILRDGAGWALLFDLPRGGGRTAADVINKRNALAAELGVDEIQLIMSRVRAAHGGHAGRLSWWVADEDPYLGPNCPSPLAEAPCWSIWDPLPFGRDARGTRIDLTIMWQSLFFGGLPRRGKTFSQRLVAAAGVLDPLVRHYVADGKGGGDWRPMAQVAHRYVRGADGASLLAFVEMLDELVAEMERAFGVIGQLSEAICPDGKLTPEISRRYGLFVTMITIDELQEYLTALDKDARKHVLDQLCRLARRGPAAGFALNLASQRPDAISVPTRLREIVSVRYCTQVIDRTSSDMVLGDGKAAQGADASVLSEDHVGVGVLVTGPASFTTIRADYMDLVAFREVCNRGRALRLAAKTLSGDALSVTAGVTAEGARVAAILSDVLEVMRHVDRMHTVDVLSGLTDLDEDRYSDYDSDRLRDELTAAGVKRTKQQVKIGDANRNGWRRTDLEGALPIDLLAKASAAVASVAAPVPATTP